MNKKEIYYGLTVVAIWLAFCLFVHVFLVGSAVAPWVMLTGFLAATIMNAIRGYFL
jgi:hypothetical protein